MKNLKMPEKKKFYITSPIFYPNANLHLGHAYTMTLCDILARYHENSFFVTGADENTAKVIGSGDLSANLDIAENNFKKLYKDLNINFSEFIRTTDKTRHWPGAIEMWSRLSSAGDIYKGTYTGLYCLNCETFYTEKELVDGKCPIHGTEPQKLEEQNYFFKLSKYTQEIKKRIEGGELQIVPQTRRNEILALLERGLEDVSFSRPKKVVPHGIPVPNDRDQVMYVWCDALTSYMTAVGFGRDEEMFKKWWPADVHVLGKDILRFHAAIWPAMLLSAGLPLPKTILVHGLITSGGQKMSKSIGNVIDPYALINEYGAEAVRYFLAAKISTFEDGDMTVDSFKSAYNGDLANGLGNLASRILTMMEGYLEGRAFRTVIIGDSFADEDMNNFDIRKYMEKIWARIQALDKKIQDQEPYKVFKVDKPRAIQMVGELCNELGSIAFMLKPIMPHTSERILECLSGHKKLEKPLFPRK